MNQKLSDLQLKAQTAILKDRRTCNHGIEVIEEDHAIVLRGSVPSEDVKNAAAAIIRDLKEVTKVKNRLQVSEDHEILEKILR